MAAYVNTTNSPQVTLPVLSLGIRMAQDVGAHRKKMYSATPTVEQELWKRAWWYALESICPPLWYVQGHVGPSSPWTG